MRNKSGDRKKEGLAGGTVGVAGGTSGPIDIFVDVDSPNDPHVLMKSPSNASILNNNRNGPAGPIGLQAAHQSPIMNNLEARIKQR